MVILAMGIGLFAPPFGLGYYAACTIAKVHPDVALRKVWPYLGALTLALLVIAAVPWFSTGFLPQAWLPGRAPRARSRSFPADASRSVRSGDPLPAGSATR